MLGLFPLVSPVASTAQMAWAERGDPRVAEGDSLHNLHRVTEALDVFEGIVEEDPGHYEGLWKAAREAVVLGLLAHGTEIENRWFRRGEELAQRAVDVDSAGIDGLAWLVFSKGLRAVQTNPLDASRLGAEVYELAHRILDMDSLHAGAYHALGVLNYEVQKLSRFQRFIATRIMGNRAFRLTSWDNAERYLKRAIELKPKFVLYHLDLGKMHIARKQTELARAALRRVLALPPVEAPDVGFQEVAARLMARTYEQE